MAFLRQLFTAGLLSLSSGAFAQSHFIEQQVEGRIVTLNGDTIVGRVSVTDEIRNQKRVIFLNAEGEPRTYMPDQIKSYAFGYSILETWYESMYFRGDDMWKQKQIFLARPASGPVKLYAYYTRGTSNEVVALNMLGGMAMGMPGTGGNLSMEMKVYYMLERPGQPMQAVNRMNFKKEGSAYFSDYPELAERISSGKLKKKDIEEVVKEYNEWKEKQGKI